MKTVLFSSMHTWPWSRQISALYPLKSKFIFNDDVLSFKKNDKNLWFVVWDEPKKGIIPEEIPFERRILWITEPSCYKKYPSWFTKEYKFIITLNQIEVNHQCTQFISPPLINWFYGVNIDKQNYDDCYHIDRMFIDKPQKKTMKISIVCSNIQTTKNHQQRLYFVKILQKIFKDRIDFYGRGFNKIQNKANAINDYFYTICLENNFEKNFWTEKVADAYLGWSVPVYAGCPNLDDYFPEESFIRIDYRNIESSVKEIYKLLEEDDYYSRLEAISEARWRVLFKFNIFKSIDDLLNQIEKN